ncbi:hypothetical protein ACJ5M8_000696 [Vibrio antiquarius]
MKFEQTSVEKIVDQYISEYKPTDTKQITESLKKSSEICVESLCEIIKLFDENMNNKEIVDSRVNTEKGVLFKTVALHRKQGFSKPCWYKLVGELLDDGYVIVESHKHYTNTFECVVLERPQKHLEKNVQLIDTLVQEHANKAEKSNYDAYFNENKIAEYVKAFQEKELEEFYKQQNDVVQSTLKQKLQAKEDVSALEPLLLEFVEGKEHITFNELKQALKAGSGKTIDNLIVADLLTKHQFVKGKNAEGKVVWFKETDV